MANPYEAFSSEILGNVRVTLLTHGKLESLCCTL